MYGYVYYDGNPVAGASVVIRSQESILSLVTASGPASPQPYFAAALSTSPLNASSGEVLTTEAGYLA